MDMDLKPANVCNDMCRRAPYVTLSYSESCSPVNMTININQRLVAWEKAMTVNVKHGYASLISLIKIYYNVFNDTIPRNYD